MTRRWTLESKGRPMTANTYRNLHHRVRADHNREVRGMWKILAMAAKVPPLGRATIDVHPLVKGGQLPDVAACAPDVKAAIDGLVDAGVLPDDTPEYLPSVTFHAPQKAGRDALLLVISEKALVLGATS